MNHSRPLQVVHLYPSEMNIYGDTGNRIVLEKRLQWRGIKFQSHLVSVKDNIPNGADIIIGGGGQDASQGVVERDLQKRKSQLKDLANDGVVMLMVCGMYQLFGKRFVTSEGVDIKGLGILPVETIAGKGRIIGNITVNAKNIGSIVGYENHSGRTYLDETAVEFAKVIKGIGNNDDSMTEGCRINNVIGTYLHGPILSKNPQLADHLLSLAIKRYEPDYVLPELDNTIEITAQEIAMSRPR